MKKFLVYSNSIIITQQSQHKSLPNIVRLLFIYIYIYIYSLSVFFFFFGDEKSSLSFIWQTCDVTINWDSRLIKHGEEYKFKPMNEKVLSLF